MANTVGSLIREARNNAGLSQEALAKKIDGVSASDISRAERGELSLPQTVLRQIAKLTGVTQSSLINAAKESTYSSSKKTSEKKTSGSSSSARKKTSTSKTSMSLTAAEKKLVELYRAADADARKKAVSLLKNDKTEMDDLLSALMDTAMDVFGKKQG